MIRIFLCLFFIFSLTSEASNSPTNLDSIAKKLGFGSWEQYQKSSKICRTLLTNIQLIKQPQCNGDLDCIMKTSKIQAKKLANDLASLRASKVWKNNKCDLMVNTSKSKSINSNKNDVDELSSDDNGAFDSGTPQCDKGTWYEKNGYC